MQPKQVILYRAVLLVILVAVTATACLVFYFNRSAEAANQPNNARISAGAGYVLREYDERIGVFRAGEDRPFTIINVYTDTLPAVDRKELQTGIPVESEEKLRRIMEDYES